MSSTVKRPARISGWIPITGAPAGAGGAPNLGGLTDVSRTGARLYVSWPVQPGQTIRLAVGEATRGGSPRTTLALRAVWVRRDQPGDIEALESRLKVMRALIEAGVRGPGTTYGYLVGARFEPGVNERLIRAIQKYFEEAGGRPRRRVETPRHLPDDVAPPPFRPA